MAKQEFQGARFCKVEVPHLVWQNCLPDLTQDETALVLAFIELCSEGVKISFSYREQQHAYCVAVTLPKTATDDQPTCATFWGDELWRALAEAYVVCDIYQADKYGYSVAQEAMKKAEKSIASEFAEFQRTKRS